MSDILKTIETEVQNNKVVLYMKGTPAFPQCGFSYRVVEILDSLQVEYHAVDVLADDAIRQGIKDYSNWPTIPQLYVDGKFIGGCDIVCQLQASDELASLF